MYSNYLVDLIQVVFVSGKAQVFVFHLKCNDGTSVRCLQGVQDLEEVVEVSSNSSEKGPMHRSQLHVFIVEQPPGEENSHSITQLILVDVKGVLGE